MGAALAAAIESGKVKREDLFITTKVSPTSQDYCLFSKRAQFKRLKESRYNKLEGTRLKEPEKDSSQSAERKLVQSRVEWSATRLNIDLENGCHWIESS